MADKKVTITVTDKNDPNGPDNFNCAPGYLQVHGGDRVRFKCNQAFTIKFLDSSPFESVSTISKKSASTSKFSTISAKAKQQSYHYIVSATNAAGLILVEGGCPTLDVI